VSGHPDAAQIEDAWHPLRGIVRDYLYGKQLEAGYNDQAAIDADHAAAHADMEAQVYPPEQADPESEAEPEPEAEL